MNKGNTTDQKQVNMVAFGQTETNNFFGEQVFSPLTETMMISTDQWNTGTKIPLPDGYSPSPESVVIGRGGHTRGRSRLRMIAARFLEQYSEANTKLEKSAIVSKIIEMVQQGCPYGAFVKFVDGRWWQVEESKAREKVGYVLRDLLHDKYRSSSQSKAAARRKRAVEKQKNSSSFSVTSNSSASCSSVGGGPDGAREGAKTLDQSNALPLTCSLQPFSATFDSSEAHGTKRNSMTSYTRSFGQSNDILEPLSFPSDSDILSSPDTYKIPMMAQSLDFQPNPQKLKSDTFGFNSSWGLKEDLTEVPVGEDLSSVFD